MSTIDRSASVDGAPAGEGGLRLVASVEDAQQPAPARRSTAASAALLAFRLACGGYAVLLVAVVIALKGVYLPLLEHDRVFAAYGICVSVYLLSRFALSLVYRPVRPREGDVLPSVAIVIPAMNEEDGIEATIDAAFGVDYPRELLTVYAVDDGSTDDTWRRIRRAARRHPGLHALRFSCNRGKRAAMAAGIRASDAEIICFVDSDSTLAADALREIVRPFRDGRVNIVCGHADVLNRSANLLTRLQQVRYYVAFRVVKSAESLFGAVSCASGCFSAYRRDRLLDVLPAWETQSFLGREATFGDDRALTNMLLRTGRCVYQSTAQCETTVPETLRRFLVQQVRWKKSWTRESLIAIPVFARKNPLASAAMYASIAFQLVGPIVAFRALVWRPLEHGAEPWLYLIGIYLMAVLYSLYYAMRRASPWWWAGLAFVGLYVTVLIWQTYWAIGTSRRTQWGTRSGLADDGGGFRLIGLIGRPGDSGIPIARDAEVLPAGLVAA